MKDGIILLLFLLITNLSFSSEIEIQLAKHEKIINTFSGDINQKSSFHAYMIKNKKTKKYEFQSFYIDEENKVSKLKSILFDKEHEVLSYHLQNQTLTFLFKKVRSNSVVEIIDIELLTNEVSRHELLNQTLNKTKVIRLEDRTLLLRRVMRGSFYLSLNIISNTKKIQEPSLLVDKDNRIYSRFFYDKTYTYVNTNTFIKASSTSTNNIFVSDNTIYYSTVNNKVVNILRLQIDDFENFLISRIECSDLSKIKDISTFIADDVVFSVFTNKDDAVVKVTNLSTNKTLFSASLENDLASYVEKNVREDFLKNTKKNAYKALICVNKAIDGSQIVRLDYKNVYTYYYNDMFWQQHMMMQQQMMQPKINFGPAPIHNELLACYFASKTNVEDEEDEHYFEFVLNKNFELVKNSRSGTIYKEVNYKGNLFKYNNNSALSKVSGAATNDSFRVIYYEKRNKKITLIVKNLIQ